MAQESSPKTSESPVQMKTQLTNQGNTEQQQPNTPQGQANNGDKNEQYVVAEQAAKSSQATPEKSHLQGSQKTSKFRSEFGIKGQTPATKKRQCIGRQRRTGLKQQRLEQAFCSSPRAHRPQSQGQDRWHGCEHPSGHRKAGEIAVRLQMKQEGVADVRLTGENAAAFDKKDELQAALQSEGLDLGKFNLSQDGHENERQEKAEDFEDDNLAVAETANTKASTRRRKDGATLHVQA